MTLVFELFGWLKVVVDVSTPRYGESVFILAFKETLNEH